MKIDKWRSVKHELPPKEGCFLGFGKDMLGEKDQIVVMLYWKGGHTEDGYEMDAGYYAANEWGLINIDWNCNPTHWIPLPELPKKHELL